MKFSAMTIYHMCNISCQLETTDKIVAHMCADKWFLTIQNLFIPFEF